MMECFLLKARLMDKFLIFSSVLFKRPGLLETFEVSFRDFVL